MGTSTDKTLHVGRVIRLAGAFCAFCIGSGFASGQEVLQFFTSHGLYSFGALAICLVLFMWFGSTIMAAGHRLRLASSSDIFSYYCGPLLGRVFEFVVPLFLFCVFVIMVSGSGAMLEQHFQMPRAVGAGIMAVVATLTVAFGLNRLVQVIGVIGPVIIALSILVGVLGILNGTVGFEGVEAATAGLNLPKAADNWALSGLLYAAFMVFGSAPFFAAMGTEAPTRRDALFGGLTGGFFLIVAATIMSTGMLCNIAAVYDKQLPALAMAGGTSALLGNGFAVILFCGIYTTAAPMLWSVCNRVFQDGTPRFRLCAVVLGILAFFCGMLPFGTLVGTVYPYTGYLGLLFMLLVAFGQLVRKK